MATTSPLMMVPARVLARPAIAKPQHCVSKASEEVGWIGADAPTQMVWHWKLQSSHFDSSSIFQNVLSHSPVSSFFSLIHSATCIMRRGMSQSLHNDSTVSSSSRGREVLLNSGPHASLSLHTSSICSS